MPTGKGAERRERRSELLLDWTEREKIEFERRGGSWFAGEGAEEGRRRRRVEGEKEGWHGPGRVWRKKEKRKRKKEGRRERAAARPDQGKKEMEKRGRKEEKERKRRKKKKIEIKIKIEKDGERFLE